MGTRFKLDENLPRDAERLLRQAGHDVHTVVDEQLSGSADTRIFEAALLERRVLVTFDLDFADIRQYPPATHCGIWVLRPRAQTIESALALLSSALRFLDSEPVDGCLWIIEPERIRIRS